MADHSTAAELWETSCVCMLKGVPLDATRKIRSWLYFRRLPRTSDQMSLALHATPLVAEAASRQH